MSPLPSINPAGKKKSTRAEVAPEDDSDADDYLDSGYDDDYGDDGYSDETEDWSDSEESAGESADPTALPPRVDRRKADPKKANKKPNGKSGKEKKLVKVKDTGPRSRKAKFPTPTFNFFGLAINTVALFVAGFTLFHSTDGFTSFSPLPLEPILLTVLGLLAVIVSMYASGVKPTAENRKTRKLLTGLSLALGVVLIVAVGFLFLL